MSTYDLCLTRTYSHSLKCFFFHTYHRKFFSHDDKPSYLTITKKKKINHCLGFILIFQSHLFYISLPCCPTRLTNRHFVNHVHVCWQRQITNVTSSTKFHVIKPEKYRNQIPTKAERKKEYLLHTIQRQN